MLLALVLRPAAIAQAQDEDRRPMAALAACVSGDVVKGIAILGELYVESRNPSFLFNQGRCYQQNGQLDHARNRFAEYLRVGKNEPPEDLQRATAFVKEIDDALANQRPPAPAPAPVLIAAAPVAAPAMDGRAHTLRITSIVLAGVGVAAVGAGVYMGFKVRSMESEVNREFAGQAVVTDGARLQRQLTDGARYETWQWVGYGVGAAALAGAATTFALGRLSSAGSGAPEHVGAVGPVALAPALAPGTVGGLLRIRF